jgi:UPF0176 protein
MGAQVNEAGTNLHAKRPFQAALQSRASILLAASSSSQLLEHTITLFENIATYRFAPLADLPAKRQAVFDCGVKHAVKGTIILAPEGVNLVACGEPSAIAALCAHLDQHLGCGPLDYKHSHSEQVSFERWKVKIKPEIITYRQPQVQPELERAPSVEPQTLARWIEQGQDDEGRALVLIDTRNDFEVQAGAFSGARSWNLQRFTQLPDALRQHAPELKDKRVVAYCTGGIRCEKAVLSMHQEGLAHAVQLQGGVLRYFEHVGQRHWEGRLFVFDERVSVDATLTSTTASP